MSSTNFPGIPVCTGVVSAPVLRSDGTIADKRGYDQQTGLFLDVEEDYPPVMPKEKAVELLVRSFRRFPLPNGGPQERRYRNPDYAFLSSGL